MSRRALDLAPDDVATLRSLADVYALGGQADEQLRLLKRVLELRPQEKDVREYVAHTEPSRPRADEAYARPSSEFLKLRDQPANGRNRRTLVDLQVTTVFPNGLASRFHQIVFQPLTDAAAAEAREYAFSFEADTRRCSYAARRSTARRARSTRPSRAARGRPTTLRWRCTRAHARSTCTSRGSTWGTSWSCCIASRT